MSKRKQSTRFLADPTKLKPIADKDGILQVVIETPKGSRNKYAFDTDQEVFTLHSVLPAGMAFPYDFGFLPRTIAGDGDPMDVLVLMDEPAFPGCVLRARLLGVIRGEQIDGKKKIRNDRLVAIAEANHMYANIKRLEDLPRHFVKELEDFFVTTTGSKASSTNCSAARTPMRRSDSSRQRGRRPNGPIIGKAPLSQNSSYTS